MQFQLILITIFSEFSGEHAPRPPVEGLKKFSSPLRGSKNFLAIDFPQTKILNRTLAVQVKPPKLCKY